MFGNVEATTAGISKYQQLRRQTQAGGGIWKQRTNSNRCGLWWALHEGLPLILVCDE